MNLGLELPRARQSACLTLRVLDTEPVPEIGIIVNCGGILWIIIDKDLSPLQKQHVTQRLQDQLFLQAMQGLPPINL